ncbi:hypothetical protein NQ317_014635 [Molorchus minor]|uniref:Sanpodo n=1 Tax=Molorchus minor TaxID=1323400 RepID=A0ABQ9JQI9_9CUCU|nr:hypothetical protein NQ317_014635 [Molorchus minor]
MATTPKYYSNPAFCQQSEFTNGQRPPQAISPQGSVRYSPVGAQTIHRVLDTSACEGRENPALDEDCVEEQEFYEEVLVDDKGFITDKKFVIVAQNNEGKKYIQAPQSERGKEGSRYGVPQNEERPGSRYSVPQQITYEPTKSSETSSKNQRYEYIPMQIQDKCITPRQSPIKKQQEEMRANVHTVHRYAVIPEKETETVTDNGRYALVPVEVLKSIVGPQTTNQNKNRYEYIQDQARQTKDRYEYIQTSPQKPLQATNRYEYIQHSPQQRISNPIATQKLYEILSTPPKELSTEDPFSAVWKKVPQKAQQKLNYALGIRPLASASQEKRHTAIVTPMSCSSPLQQSVYSETTYSKSESWMNLSMSKPPVQATLTLAALVMLACGGVTCGVCFYMISRLGRLYYLDFGIVSGFTSLVLGLLGFRSRHIKWLPNRNYVSGYLVLSFFSLLTCAGLLVLLSMQPMPGTPLADMTSGAVCAISALTVLLATSGFVSSYCCKYLPPDNRVQHSVEGFTV